MGPPSRAMRTPSWRGISTCARRWRGPRERRAVLFERPGQYPGMRRWEGRAHDHHMLPESPKGADRDRAAERRSTTPECRGILEREQDDSELIRREKVGETPAGAGPGDSGAGLGEVFLEQHLDFFRLRIGRRILARGPEHEMALAIDLPLTVRGVGEKRTTRKKQRCPREGPCEKGAPAGAPLRDDGSLSGDTC